MTRSIVEIMEDAVDAMKNSTHEPMVVVMHEDLYSRMEAAGCDMSGTVLMQKELKESTGLTQASKGPRSRWGQVR